MPVIGELATLITARTAPFEKSMAKSRAVAKNFSKTIEQQSGAMESKWAPALSKVGNLLAGPLGITLSAAGAAAAVKQFASTILEHGQAIEKLGETAAGIGMKASEFMALEFAAQQTGVSTETLTRAMRDFNVRTADAAKGSGDAAKAFAAMGINAADFLQLSMEERLGIVADKLNSLGTEAERAAMASDLFGKAGKGEMLTMLAEGSEGIKKLTAAAERLGLVLNDDVVAAIGRSNDAIDRLKARSEGLWRHLTAELMPAIGATAEELDTLADKIPGGRKGGRSAVSDMADMLMTPVSPGTLPLRMLAKRQYARGQQMVEEERGRRLDAELARRRNQGGAPAAATNQDRQQTEYLREMTQLQRAELEWQQQVQALYRDNQRFTTVQNLN
jgi:hypothetical protein